MTIEAGRNTQPDDAGAMLCRLADPEAPALPVGRHEAAGLIEAGRVHGVGPILLRKLKDHRDAEGFGRLRAEVERITGMTLLLDRIAGQFQQAIDKASLPAAIVKGPVFARQLYRHRSDRPFTDIDILAAPAAATPLSELLAAMGYKRHRKAAFDRSAANEEDKWVNPQLPTVLVEVHGNLVHYPMLRRRAGFGHGELMAAGGGDPASPVALFLTAVVHAALGHKFHQLRFLVDVLQAYRKLDEGDRAALARVTGELGLRLEAGLCLDLIAALFGEAGAAALARSLAPGLQSGVQAGLARRLVDGRAVLSAPHSLASLVRRRLFRLLQHLARRHV